MTLVIAPIVGRENIHTLLPPEGKGVEIGTHIGEFAEYILSNWNGTLYCIDPWKSYPDYEEQYEFLWGKEHGKFYDQAVSRLQKYETRCHLIRDTSEEVAKSFRSKVDFVYIDGNHSYEYVLRDLAMWYPKLNSHGLLMGHDFFMPGAIVDNMQDEVQEAVIYFAKIHALDVYIIPEIGDHPWSFYMVKP